MSIWGSSIDCGEDDDGVPDGSVINYVSGFSNHYPHTTFGDDHPEATETTAAVGTASIAPWCVPGNFDRDDLEYYEGTGQWLRLDVAYRKTSVWSGEFTVADEDVASVILREDAVRKLRDQLDKWLAIPKLDGEKK